MDRFKYKTSVRVRNFEVDWQGIVHNANYLLYFEIGRIEYLRHVGIPVSMETIMGHAKIVLARNEIDYRSPAKFDDLLDVYTRVASINNTSFTFEGIITESDTQRVISNNIAVHVWLDAQTNLPTRVPDSFRELVMKFEGESVTIRK